ncbi:MAG: adenine phosphoribosyltransferase [Acidimicrobiales bacterium]
MATDASWLRHHLRDIEDFPSPGVTFKDITPLLGDATALRGAVDAITGEWADIEVDFVAGIEARGFLLAAPVAYHLGAGLVPIRKPGKLPWEVVEAAYELEYGIDRIEVHRDAVAHGERVLIVDDVLATGGTARAACELLEGLGAEVLGVGVLLELGFLHGRARLKGRDVRSVLVEA